MSNDEAVSNAGPLKTPGKSYFSAVCILFIIIAALCANNLLVYRYYQEIRNQFEITVSKFKSLNVNNMDSSVATSAPKPEDQEITESYGRLISENEEIMKKLEEIRQQNDALLKKNQELTEDNIALQNSVKMAAAAGIKPQNYGEFEGVSSRGDIERGTYIGKFLGTAYTPSVEECGNNKGITNSGKPIIPGVSIAIDNKYWPFGTVFYIKGLGYAVAMDTGSAIKGKYRFDFAVFDKNFAKTLGSKEWDVYLVKKGNGKVGDIVF